MVGQAVVGEREGQEVRGANHTLVEVWRWRRRWWRSQRELSGQRGVNGSDGLPSAEEPPAAKRFRHMNVKMSPTRIRLVNMMF